MNVEEKMTLLEELFEVEPGELSEKMILEDFEEWDSMSRMSLIVLMEDIFGKKVTRKEVMEYKTIGDIMSAMESEE